MSLERLKQKETFITYKKGDDLEAYLKKLVIWIEDEIYKELTERVNWIIGALLGDGLEMIDGSNTDYGQNGNWRLKIVSNNLQFERLESGTWDKKGGIPA